MRLFDKQLKAADGAIAQLIRKAAPGSQLYRRFLLSTPVTRKGVNIRMGKGKGDIENMATRWPTGKVVFEVGGQMHDQVVKEAFKRASRRLPGRWEVIKKGDLPVVGSQEVPEATPKLPAGDVREPHQAVPGPGGLQEGGVCQVPTTINVYSNIFDIESVKCRCV